MIIRYYIILYPRQNERDFNAGTKEPPAAAAAPVEGLVDILFLAGDEEDLMEEDGLDDAGAAVAVLVAKLRVDSDNKLQEEQ